MNKPELINAVAKKADISQKEAALSLDALTEIITEELKAGQQVYLNGLGTFDTIEK